MIDTTILKAMAAAGATVEVIIAAVEAAQAKDEAVREARREKDKARKRDERAADKAAKSATVHDGPAPSDGQVRTNTDNSDTDSETPSSSSPPITPLLTTPSPSLRSDSSARARGPSNEKARETSNWPPDAFDQFWNAYPRKKAKKAAARALERIRREGEVSFDRIMAGVRKIKTGEPVFIKHPATWLNAGCWDDEETPGENTNGQGRPRAFQNDALSCTKAADRLEERIEREGITEFPPRPTLLPRKGQGDLQLLPPRRGTGS